MNTMTDIQHVPIHETPIARSALLSSRSMQGRIIEVHDILTRLCGADMELLATIAPLQFAKFASALSDTRDAAIELESICRELA